VVLVDPCRKSGGNPVGLGDQAGTSIRERPGATNLLSSTCAAPHAGAVSLMRTGSGRQLTPLGQGDRAVLLEERDV